MKLLVDMNLSPSWVERLVRHEFWNQVKARQADIRGVTSNGDPKRFSVHRRDFDTGFFKRWADRRT